MEVGSLKLEVGERWEDFQTSDDRKTWKRRSGFLIINEDHSAKWQLIKKQ
jgi:hypothetical protein